MSKYEILGIVALFIVIDVIVDLLLMKFMKWWQVKKIEREEARLEAIYGGDQHEDLNINK